MIKSWDYICLQTQLNSQTQLYPQTKPQTQPNSTWKSSCSKFIAAKQFFKIILTDDSVPSNGPIDKVAESKKITRWVEISGSELTQDNCSICLCEFDETSVKLSQCNHIFHSGCISMCFNNGFVKCPICLKVYGIRIGTQPNGTMCVQFLTGGQSLAGYEKYDTIQIVYKFPGGVQGPQHPNPGVKYGGTTRTCYVPYTEEGIVVLELLIIAFKRRLIFSVGTSITTGISNTIVWNGIHHKTSFNGAHGFPDETYLVRVKEELKDNNVIPEDIQEDKTLIISQASE